MRKAPWRLLALPEAAIAALSVMASVREGRSLPALLICGALLALHAFGLPTALALARRAGLAFDRAFLLTLLLGPAWWGPLLGQRATHRPAGGKTQLPPEGAPGYSEASCPATGDLQQEGPPSNGKPASSTPSNPAAHGDSPSA